MKLHKITTLILMAAITTGALAAEPKPIFKDGGRIAISSDGNEHDWDDWAASAMTLAMIGASGLTDELTLYTYADHVWGSNQERPNIKGMCAYNHVRESVIKGAEYFGCDKTRLICAVDNAEVAYNAMRDEINLSSAESPLYILGAGPMQVIGEGMNRADKSKLKYVTVVSHSGWNNNHSDKPNSSWGYYSKTGWDNHSGWTWDEMIESFGEGAEGVATGDGANFIKIKDQNSGWGKYTALKCEREHFDWLKSSSAKRLYPKGSWEWLYSRLESCAVKDDTYFDVSDAGLLGFLITGNECVSPEMLRNILENPKH